MKAIFKRELGSLLRSMRVWLFAFLTLAAAGALVYLTCIRPADPQYEKCVRYLAAALAVFIPLVTAPSLAGERRQHTERLLHSLPVRPAAIALGKLFACLVPVLAVCALLFLYPISLSLVGINCLKTALFCHVLLCFFACLVTALGVLLSGALPIAPLAWLATVAVSAAAYFLPSLTGSMQAATGMTTMGMVGLIALFFLFWMLVFSGNAFAALLATALCEVPVLICRLQGRPSAPMRFVGRLLKPLAYFEPLGVASEGVLRLSSLVYYLSLTAFCVALTALVLRARRQGERRALA